jgi:alpha-L-fucosidase
MHLTGLHLTRAGQVRASGRAESSAWLSLRAAPSCSPLKAGHPFPFSLALAALLLSYPTPSRGEQLPFTPHPGTPAILSAVDSTVAKGPFAAAWPSLERFEVPAWYQDGKFGIFIHWGLYAVPAFGNEWYPRNMYRQGEREFAHHVAAFGPQARSGYKDFIPRFKAERYDPQAWARLFKDAGARFVVPVAEHHDGFPMYDCSLTEWSAARMGPKRDLVGDLARAVKSEGLVFGHSSHRAEHWWFFDGGMAFDSDVRDPRYSGFYGPARPQKKAEDGSEPPSREYLDDWLARTAELVDKYQPQLVWFDWWIEQPVFQPYLQRFAAFYYNRGAEWRRGVAINYKNKSFPAKAAVFDVERGQLPGIRPEFWQTDTSVSKNSWGYVEKQDYKTTASLVGDLVDIVSKNGALLLNIGPRPDGTIPEPEQEILRCIGRWLAQNGEAVYGTRPWAVFGEGPTEVVGGSFNDTKRQAFTGRDIRFTTKAGVLYAIALAWPGKTLSVKSLATGAPHAKGRVTGVRLLGHDGELHFTQDADGLHVTLPETAPGEHAFAFRVEGAIQ